MAEDQSFDEAAPGWQPALDQIVQAVPDAPGVTEAATYLNDYVQRRGIADANAAAGQNFANDLADFRQGMTSFVSNDPTLGAVQATMKATVPMVNGVVGTLPGDNSSHADTLIKHIHGEIAASAVTSAAEKDADLARSLLDHPDVSGALDDGAAANLRTYIDMQDRARTLDQHVAQREAAAAADTRANHAMFGFASDLWNKGTNNLVFPPVWNQALLSNNDVMPADTATLRQLYGRLAVDGGAATSDPFLVHGIVNDIADGGGPPAREILAHAAQGNVRFPDALHLASLTSDPSGDGRAHAAGLAGLLDQGKTAIMADDPIAGARAYGRYVNWLLPQYQQTGPAGANPDHPGYLMAGGLTAFLPRAEDLVPVRSSGSRRSLADIFAGGKLGAPKGETEQEVFNRDFREHGNSYVGGVDRFDNSDGDADAAMNRLSSKRDERTGDTRGLIDEAGADSRGRPIVRPLDGEDI